MNKTKTKTTKKWNRLIITIKAKKLQEIIILQGSMIFIPKKNSSKNCSSKISNILKAFHKTSNKLSHFIKNNFKLKIKSISLSKSKLGMQFQGNRIKWKNKEKMNTIIY